MINRSEGCIEWSADGIAEEAPALAQNEISQPNEVENSLSQADYSQSSPDISDNCWNNYLTEEVKAKVSLLALLLIFLYSFQRDLVWFDVAQ